MKTIMSILTVLVAITLSSAAFAAGAGNAKKKPAPAPTTIVSKVITSGTSATTGRFW